MNENTSAGPATTRMISPFGPSCPAAAVPIAPKIPAPITAPIASMIKSPAPSVRLRLCAPVASSTSAAIGFRWNSCDICGRGLYFVLPRGRQAIRGLVGCDDEHAVERERDADQTGARQHELGRRIGAEPVQPARSGERLDD